MKKPLVIFGTGKIAEVVSYYATQDCGYEIAAYTVDKAHLNQDVFLGKPVYAFDEIERHCPYNTYDMFVAVGYHDMNKLRESKYSEARAKGYALVSIVSPNAHVPGNVIFKDNCFIMPPAIIHPCVTLGANTFVWSGALVGHHSVIDDHCWLTSNANIGGNVKMGKNCFVAINATVAHSVIIGHHCFLGANTLLTKNLEDQKVVIAESSKPIKLNSEQFLKFSSFSSL